MGEKSEKQKSIWSGLTSSNLPYCLHKPLIIGSDDDPFPNILEANTFMMISNEGKQDDVVTSNSCMHTKLLHWEAGIVYEPQRTSLVEAEYVIVYDVGEPLMVSAIVALLEI